MDTYCGGQRETAPGGVQRGALTQFFLFFFFESLSMLLPTLEWLVALLMLETLSEECCLRMRRSAAWVLPFPGESKQGVWALE